MSKAIGYLNTTSGVFANLFSLVNTLCQVLDLEIVTANSASGGAMTLGNGFVSGIFGANTLVSTTIQGGNVTTITALSLGSNLISNGNIIATNTVTINDTSISTNLLVLGNSTSNVIANTLGVFFYSPSTNTTLTANSLWINNPTVTATFGNTTNGTTVNTSAFIIQGASNNSVNAVGIFQNFNIQVGNSTTNATINSSGYFFDGSSIGTSPGAPNTAVQFANGTYFGGSAGFTFNYLTNTAYVANTLVVNNFSVMPTTQVLDIIASAVSWNVAAGVIGTLTLSSSATVANPTSLAPGTYALIVTQPASGNGTTLAWGNTYYWPAGVAPILSTAAGAVDVISFLSDGTRMLGTFMTNLET